MFTRKPLSIAMAAAFGVAAAGSFTNVAFAQEAEATSDDAMIEEIVTTGSRIKRSTNTQSQEIITITAEDMQLSGDISVADALRSSTMNSLGSFRESSGSSAQSNATINLRGMGASRSLVLINGRRVVGSPSLGGGGTVNLNMIPFSAVDRIELIADGGSAIYGSDAVTGVINIILKKNYDGLTINARYGDRSRDDGTEESISIVGGAKSDKGSVTFALEYDARDPIFDRDREFTAPWWKDLDGDGYIQNNETSQVSLYGYTLINPNYNGNAFDPTDENTWYFHPGAGCTEGDGFTGPIRYGQGAGAYGFYCGYAYAFVSANRAGIERLNSYVSAEYEVSDNIDFYTDIIFAQNESFGRYAPPAAPGPTIAGDPRNSIGAAYGYFRWVDIGFRDNVVSDTLTDINVGLRGEVSDSISWEAGYTHSSYKSASMGMYYLSYSGIEYNNNYGPFDYETTVANMKATTVNDDTQTMNKMFAGIQFDLFELSGGTASAYAGMEHYKVDYAALVDAQSEAGLVGGSAGNSARGYRDVTAYFAEAVLPVTDYLEVDIAVRHDNYSDFGSATSPRIGATMTVPGYEQLTIKASYGQGFRAPDLSDLYGATSFSAESATDYYGCVLQGIDPNDDALCTSGQVNTYIGSNPNLDAEKSETFSIGAEWNFYEDWALGVNYFDLMMEDKIEYVSAQDQLNVDYFTDGGNPMVVRDTAGRVVSISAGFQNGITEMGASAVDFALRGGFDTEYGSFDIAGNATYYVEYDYETTYGTGELGDAAGTLGFPEWRSNLYVGWSMDDYFASLNYDHIGESSSKTTDNKFKSWGTINASVGYNWADYGTFTLGANNLTDKDPLLDSLGRQIDEYQYDHTGRVVFVRWSKEF